MTPSERAREIATEWYHQRGFPCDGVDLPSLENIIAAALTIPPGHVRDEYGELLPLSGDGNIIRIDDLVYVPHLVGTPEIGTVHAMDSVGGRMLLTLYRGSSVWLCLVDPCKCFTSIQSALSARGGGT